jgi:hypothetical protein
MARQVRRAALSDIAAEQEKAVAGGRRGADIQVREPPTYAQWAGFRLLWAVLILIAALLLALLAYLAVVAPRVTDFGVPVTTDSLALYQRASDQVFQRVTDLVDQVVIKTLLPVLTLLLGYVFGARVGQSSPPREGDQ